MIQGAVDNYFDLSVRQVDLRLEFLQFGQHSVVVVYLNLSFRFQGLVDHLFLFFKIACFLLPFPDFLKDFLNLINRFLDILLKILQLLKASINLFVSNPIFRVNGLIQRDPDTSLIKNNRLLGLKFLLLLFRLLARARQGIGNPVEF